MTIKFKNHYSQIGKKEEFKVKYDEKDMTDQSQLCSASIVEMARKYGIDAIIAKAEQRNLEAGAIQDKLYGHDFTNMFKSREELLNTKKKLNNIFENIPARMRKEYFNDNPMEFINAYTSNDEKKLGKLAEIGLVSETQLNAVKTYNANKRAVETENANKARFIEQLEKQQGALYENFKKTGNITISNLENNTTPNTSIPPSLS